LLTQTLYAFPQTQAAQMSFWPLTDLDQAGRFISVGR